MSGLLLRSFSLRSFSEAVIYLDKMSGIAHLFERVLGLINNEDMKSIIAFIR
jgi:hypothetical protein